MPVDYGSFRTRRSPAQVVVAAVEAATGLGFTRWLVGGARCVLAVNFKPGAPRGR